MDLCKFANVEITENGCGMCEFKLFQKYLLLEKFIIKVYEIGTLGSLDIIYNGEFMLFENSNIGEYKKIYILFQIYYI